MFDTIGTEGIDLIFGSAADDMIDGKGGDDIIFGTSFNAVLGYQDYKVTAKSEIALTRKKSVEN